MSSDFRALDVDQWDEEPLTAADLAIEDPRSAAELLQIAQQKQSGVRTRLASNDTAGALAAILDDAPSGHHAEEAKRVTFALLLETLNATRSTDIPAALRTLDLAQRETLMKYLYKGLALGGTRAGAAEGINCAVLLLWHEKLTQVAGTGCIMRVMTDRRVL
ncbi:arp2/3 complex subunit [Malassezia furfur]|uniref:Actin-related protein 2/3 complex subunit 5 n=1 Tax=Malassezia furfur TaxID=55194 RepID=A0ABY8EUN1_MALFU|nr:ARC15 [Malassezia furfur]WFD49257.1 arp2/3 complex subunit [Malassezia furfur]